MNTEIPEEFPNHYPTAQERREQWEAFNKIKIMLHCPANLSYKDARDWIDSKFEVAEAISDPHFIYRK